MHLKEDLWFYVSMGQAIVYVIIATSLFTVINVVVKYLSHLPASEVVVFRAATSLLLCLFFIWRKKTSFLGYNKPVLIGRGVFGTLGLLSLFTCLQNIPLAVAMTLINLSPILTVVIAHFYLKEKASVQQWLFLVFSFVGVFLVRGSIEPVPWPWMVLGFLSGFFAAIAYTCVRKLRTTEDPLVVILYFPLVTIPLMGPVVVYQWKSPVGYEWLLLLIIGVLAQGAQYFMTLAYQMETAAKVMIFNYAGLFWAVILGWSLFDESLSLSQIAGVFIVFFCLCGNYLVSLKSKKIISRV